jgi:hypothetical protein
VVGGQFDLCLRVQLGEVQFAQLEDGEAAVIVIGLDQRVPAIPVLHDHCKLHLIEQPTILLTFSEAA